MTKNQFLDQLFSMTIISLFLTLIIGILFFSLELINQEDKNKIQITSQNHTENGIIQKSKYDYPYVASINGKLYYSHQCKQAQAIKDKYLIWLRGREEAEESGYKPSSCLIK